MQHNISSMYADFTDYWFPTLKIGYADEQAYKPQIIITGEKTDLVVIQALKKYTQQTLTWINLPDLETESKKYDLNKDLLLLLIEKDLGNTPIRGFEFDKTLRQYTDLIFSFKRKAALVIVDPQEGKKIEEIKHQANLQLPDNLKKQVIVTNSLWQSRFLVAQQIQNLFEE